MICNRCLTVYGSTVSCPECRHVPRTERMGYEPPAPCEPWRVKLEFAGAQLEMTISHEGERKFVHRVIRHFGGGPIND